MEKNQVHRKRSAADQDDSDNRVFKAMANPDRRRMLDRLAELHQIKLDQEAVQGYIGNEFKPNGGAHAGRDWGAFDIQKEVIDLCPTDCMVKTGKKLIAWFYIKFINKVK